MKPAKTPAAIASGARSRFDDFIVTHILQTMSIHGTVRRQGTTICTWLMCLGKLPQLAPLLHLGLRTSSTQRVRIQGLSPVQQLVKMGKGSARIAPLRRQQDQHFGWRRVRRWTRILVPTERGALHGHLPLGERWRLHQVWPVQRVCSPDPNQNGSGLTQAVGKSI